jgi:hypothetical protein
VTITEIDISQGLADYLGSEVDARREGDRFRVLTPVEYPDGDGVVVRVEPTADGRFTITDGGSADATLAGRVGRKAIVAPADSIARRFDATFDGGQVRATVGLDGIADGCWRVAQAASAIAEAATYQRPQPGKDPEFVQVIATELRSRSIPVEADRKLEGASGHIHTASLFVPATETVIEPVTGERAWNVATSVYVEFGDLGQANGYNLVAVVDDREGEVGADIFGLLRQVADVASWRQHDEWIDGLLGRRLT